MGDVGDEIAAHGLDALEIRDVAGEHERLPVAIGHELHREHVFAAPRLAQGERLAVVLPLQVVDELRLAHQEGNALPEVARAVQAEMLLGYGIAPIDAVRRVQYDQAVGHGRARLPEILERRGQPGLALALPAQHAVEIAEDAIPQAAPGRHRFRVRVAQPPGEERDVPQVVEQQRREHGHGGDECPWRAAPRPRRQARRLPAGEGYSDVPRDG